MHSCLDDEGQKYCVPYVSIMLFLVVREPLKEVGDYWHFRDIFTGGFIKNLEIFLIACKMMNQSVVIYT